MNTKVKYECDKCHRIFVSTYRIGEIPNEVFHLGCGGLGRRFFSPPTMIDKIEDTVSFAIQKMMFSKSPSNKDKSIL